MGALQLSFSFRKPQSLRRSLWNAGFAIFTRRNFHFHRSHLDPFFLSFSMIFILSTSSNFTERSFSSTRIRFFLVIRCRNEARGPSDLSLVDDMRVRFSSFLIFLLQGGAPGRGATLRTAD